MGELRDRMEADLRLRGYAEKTRPATQLVHAAALRFLYRITLQQPELAARIPRLLAALRAYWRTARPRGPYFFPGATPDRPLSRDAAQRALRHVAAPLMHRLALLLALIAATPHAGAPYDYAPVSFTSLRARLPLA